MAQKKADLCRRVSQVLLDMADGKRRASAFPRAVSAHLKTCAECRRKEEAVARTIADWSCSDPVDRSKPDSELAYQLANRIVRAVCCYAQGSPDPVKRRGLYLVHDAVLQILGAGAKRVLVNIPVILEEIAEDRAHYFVSAKK